MDKVYKDIDDIIADRKRYKLIYADPPWEYGNFSNGSNKVNRKRLHKVTKFGITPYQGMRIQDIQNLHISYIADTDAVLLMWITYPCLNWMTDVIGAWGFKFKTIAFTWIKQNKGGVGIFKGLGNYTRANAEICVLATRGKGLPVLDRSISQIQMSPVTAHSKKPDEIRTKINRLFGHVSPKIELFARTKIAGWDVFGNDEKLDNTPLEEYCNDDKQQMESMETKRTT